MYQIKTKLGDGGRIVIPAEYRQAMGLQVGDEVILRLEGKELRILTLNQAIQHAQELVRQYIPQERSLANELIAERRLEEYR